MVLKSMSRRTAAPAGLAAAAVLAAMPMALTGCKASLFDDGSQVTGPDGPIVVGAECPAECLGDAARDFDGTAGGTGNHWRYLDDTRDRSWTAMTPAAGKLTGTNPATTISKCTTSSTATACTQLPGALLISTAGMSANADPALEFAIATKRVVKIGVRAFVPTTAPEQQIRVYRNSREDLLFTGPAAAGTLFEKGVFADVIPGDRILLAVAPASGGATDVGLELFISDVGTTSSCQVALSFNEASGNTIPGACGAAFTSYDYLATDTEVAPTLGDGPFPELGKAAVIAPGKYYKGSQILDKSKDVTIQFWMRVTAVDSIYVGYPFSDLDLDNNGGVSIDIFDSASPKIESLSYTGVGTPPYAGTFVSYPNSGAWQFIRLVHTQGKVSLCANGKRTLSYDHPEGKLNSGYPPFLGMNVKWPSVGAYFDGAIDDFRVVSMALPCE
jgi:Concanavalin A-like lectin/glucanases superfamily